jgi:hypothetical protein
LYATFDDWRSVAAQVHLETMSHAVRPAVIERPAVLKCSDVCLVPANRKSSQTSREVAIEKREPRPATTSQPTLAGRTVLWSSKNWHLPSYWWC